jgi:uncharacterized protein YkwD
MINFLKKHFIPGSHNDHQPHILKRRAVFFVLELLLVVEIFFLVEMLYIIPYTNLFSSVLSNVLVDLTNMDRQSNNVQLLRINPLLEEAAKMKVADMAQKGYFSHVSPSGRTPWEWLDEVGYNYKYAGENLAVNFSDSEDIEKAWMNSEGHRKNIVNSHFTEIGIATARGLYKNRDSIFVVQFFGSPAKIVPVVEAQTTSSQEFEEIATKPVKTEGAVKGEETFVAVEDANVEPIAPAQVADEEEFIQSSFLQRVFVMPKTIVDYVYFFIAGIIVIALILKFFIKIKIQYPKLVFNGVIVLFVIISILYFNYLITGPGLVF